MTCYSETAHRGARALSAGRRGARLADARRSCWSRTRDREPLAECLELIRERLGNDLHSLWFNSNCERTNAVLGPAFQNWCGPASVIERFGGPAVHYPPGAFGQNNLDIAERIVEHVRQHVPAARALRSSTRASAPSACRCCLACATIRMNEVSPHSLQGLALGLAGLDAASRAKVEVVPGPAGAACGAASGVDVVIADPPRKGLDRELVEYLCEQPPGRFLYVSCGLDSFLERHRAADRGGKLAPARADRLQPHAVHRARGNRRLLRAGVSRHVPCIG